MLTPLLVLGITGLLAAVILFFVAKRFAVEEDERVAAVEAVLPGANCGACGCKGCHDFAVTCCGADSLDGLHCPGAGDAGMKRIAEILGFTVDASEVRKAFLMCNGSCTNRLVALNQTAPASCRLAASLAWPEGYCSYGCLGCGDCVAACRFDALHLDAETGLPVVDLEKCTGCGACAKACPRSIILIRQVTDAPVVRVACSNLDRGPVARKACKVACIACGKCARTCPSHAITVANNLAVIDPTKCTGCGSCVEGCPTKAIHIITNAL